MDDQTKNPNPNPTPPSTDPVPETPDLKPDDPTTTPQPLTSDPSAVSPTNSTEPIVPPTPDKPTSSPAPEPELISEIDVASYAPPPVTHTAKIIDQDDPANVTTPSTSESSWDINPIPEPEPTIEPPALEPLPQIQLDPQPQPSSEPAAPEILPNQTNQTPDFASEAPTAIPTIDSPSTDAPDTTPIIPPSPEPTEPALATLPNAPTSPLATPAPDANAPINPATPTPEHPSENEVASQTQTSNDSAPTAQATPETSTSPDKPKKSKAPLLVLILIGLVTLALVTAGAWMALRPQTQSVDLEPAPTTMPLATTCNYEGQTYQAGEGFTATDGCNSCTCGENGEVACTAMACEADISTEEIEDKTITVLDNDTFSVNDPLLGYSTQFNISDGYVQSCTNSDGETYPLVIFSNQAEIGDGPCGVEGPNGIRLSQISDSSNVECWPDDEEYELEQSSRTINNYEATYCRSTLIDPSNEQAQSQNRPLRREIVSAYIFHPTNESAMWVWMTDINLQSTFDQILSTFEFTD